MLMHILWFFREVDRIVAYSSGQALHRNAPWWLGQGTAVEGFPALYPQHRTKTLVKMLEFAFPSFVFAFRFAGNFISCTKERLR